MKFTVEEMAEKPGSEVVEFLADAYLESPLVMAVFSEDKVRLENNRKLFKLAIEIGMLDGIVLCIKDGKKIVGLLHYAVSPFCSPPPEVQKELSRVTSKSFGEDGLRIAEWFMTWGKLHPNTEHWHLGPFAVCRTYRGLGLGGLLMQKYCEIMDDANAVGYLETDYPQNVAFYNKYGFTVKLEHQVIHVMNWFMERSPKTKVHPMI